MERNLMWILKQLHLSPEQGGKNQMRDMDLSPTQGILLYYLLANKEQDVYGMDLHAVLGLSKSSVSSTLKALKEKGYITTNGSPMDDRKKQIVLTQKAYDGEKALYDHLLAQQKRLCSGIPEQYIQWMEQDLNKMMSNMKQERE